MNGRSIKSLLGSHRLMLLAPAGAPVEPFANVTRDRTAHEAMLHRVQRLRGEVYVDDGAAPEQLLDASGRHVFPDDPSRWHVVLVDANETPQACLGLHLHLGHPHTSELALYRLMSHTDAEFNERLHATLNDLIDAAAAQELGFGEVGGWAVSDAAQRTGAGMGVLLAGWSLFLLVGHHMVASVANVRGSSSSILQRTGGFRLQDRHGELPSVLHPVFANEVELLGFDTRKLPGTYRPHIRALAIELARGAVCIPSIDTSALTPSRPVSEP